MTTPSDPPPTYDEAAASGSGSSNRPTHLPVPHRERNGIPADIRRSMEDEGRPLPHGWIRQYDSQNHHQFFVDTHVDPPRSIWQHPYDDEQFMKNLDPVERTRVQNLHRIPSEADIVADSSDDDGDHGERHSNSKPPVSGGAELPPRGPPPTGGVTKFGRKMKDKMTHTTHEQREAQRVRRAEEERRTYARHMALRQAMSRAAQTGEPQFIGMGKDGKKVYIEPPQNMGRLQGGYGYNPYTQGPYSHPGPGGTYIRPQYPYSRPYGAGYGGGFGLPLAGGLMGGLLLGDMMF